MAPADTETLIDPGAVPRLNSHFRLQWEPAQDCHVLLYPEGMVKLNGSAGLILAAVDGASSLSTIIKGLQTQFPDVDSIPADTLAFMETALEQRWITLD